MTDQELSQRLQAFFPADEIKWKPQAVKGTRAMAIAYINARVVMDRLDEVVGPGAWKDDYEMLPNGSVLCVLSLKVGGEWVPKGDVGSESEQPDGGDRCKAAVSDALKRAAVKWGIGRYLYGFPQQWCDFDPAKKAFAVQPKLPAWAIPTAKGSSSGTPGAKPAPEPAKPAPTPEQDEREKIGGRLQAGMDKLIAEKMFPDRGAVVQFILSDARKSGEEFSPVWVEWETDQMTRAVGLLTHAWQNRKSSGSPSR